MKRLMLFLFTSLLIVSTGFGQYNADDYANLLANRVIEESDGYLQYNEIRDSAETESVFTSYSVKFSSFYDFDLVRLDVNSIVRGYSDINFSKHWYMDEDGDYVAVLKMPEDHYAWLFYFPVSNRLSIIIKFKDADKPII